MSDEEKERQIEKLTLLPDRYYIILNKVDEDSFTLTAYDTTGIHDDKNPCSAAIAQEGLLEMVDIDLNMILKMGLVRIKNRDLVPMEDNVIKVDFGRKQ
jgi:hypothetical protein